MAAKELLPRAMLIDKIYDQLGGVEKVMRQTGIHIKTLQSWETSTKHSGREPTVKGILEILALTATEPLNRTLRQLARELLTHFTQPAGMRVSSDDPLEELRYVLALLEQRAGLPPAVKPYYCPECGEPLKIEAFVSGVPVFSKCTMNRHEKTERDG